jgi:hypothetical protein
VTATAPGSVVMSTLEFDVLWEAEELPRRHVVLEVPSPGVTHSERGALTERAWELLAGRGFATGRTVASELADMLRLVARPRTSVDVWVWADRRIHGLAASSGSQAVLVVIDADEVWLIPVRDSSLAEAAVSVSGELGAGVGSSVSVPHEVLLASDREAGGEARALVPALEDRGVALSRAQELAGMLLGTVSRGQFGAQRAGADGTPRRASRVVAFHDTDAGRYLVQLRPGDDGRDWATVTPSDNALLAQRVWELLDET